MGGMGVLVKGGWRYCLGGKGVCLAIYGVFFL